MVAAAAQPCRRRAVDGEQEEPAAGSAVVVRPRGGDDQCALGDHVRRRGVCRGGEHVDPVAGVHQRRDRQVGQPDRRGHLPAGSSA